MTPTDITDLFSSVLNNTALLIGILGGLAFFIDRRRE